MLIALIRKDDATEVPREVADIEAARALATADMPVFILEGGVKIPVAEYGREPALGVWEPVSGTESVVGETVAAETEAPAPESETPAEAAPQGDAPQA